MCAKRRQRGLTFIELIMFMIIVSVALVGILSVMNVVVKSSADPVVRKQAIAMADAILEEVLSKDYTPNGVYPQPAANTCPDRALADDIADYANCNGTAYIAGNDTLGSSSIPGLDGYKARIGVESATVNGVETRKVTVTVTDLRGDAYSLSGYRANY